MKWYRKSQADPFAFQEKVTKAPAITWPEKKWSPPLDPKDVVIPPPPPNKEVLVNEIMRMISGVETEKLLALRDKLRGEGFWKGLLSEPKPGKAKEMPVSETPFLAKSPEEELRELGTPKESPAQEPYEPQTSSPAIRDVREKFRIKPPPPARPIGSRPMTDYEERLRGQSSQ